MPTIAALTLGCKVNQYDTQAMLEQFLQAGYKAVPFGQKADVTLINTCAVTKTGEKKSLQALHRAQRLNPEGEIILAGCVAQRDGEKLLSTGARLILGTARRNEAMSLFREAMEEGRQICAVRGFTKAPFERLSISSFADHTRAVIKIQEGCDRYCSYCIIPYCRGGIASRPPEDILQEARRLAEAGFREAVLTGIHLTSYGRDLAAGITLTDALEACAQAPFHRIRLGSLEPVIVTEEFVGKASRIGKLCPQFHLALQSGSDTVLRRMRRRYTTREFMDAAALLRSAFEGCALTTDLISGFPGETEKEAAATEAFVREVGFSRIHVFPFSPREGTPAASMPGQVPQAIRDERARRLIRIGKELALRYHSSQIGSTREVLIERILPDGTGEGYTREYVPCRTVPAGSALTPGQILPVRVLQADANGILTEAAG